MTSDPSGMAVADHVPRFRRKSSEWLLAMEAELEAEETIYISQAMGNKSMQRDLRALQDKLGAISFVLNERSPSAILSDEDNTNQRTRGVIDFSEL